MEKKQQLLAVTRLESSSGQDQAKALLTARYDWKLDEKVHLMCCDTTASNTAIERSLCTFGIKTRQGIITIRLPPSRVRTRFKSILKQKSTVLRALISHCLKCRDKWKTINPDSVEAFTYIIMQHFNNTTIDLLTFYKDELQKTIVRDDNRETD